MTTEAQGPPKSVARNVLVVKTYDCGCGFRCEQEREAMAHASSSAHSLTIHGRVVTERRWYGEEEE